jgi:putative peptide zinc metalloprotease protein
VRLADFQAPQLRPLSGDGQPVALTRTATTIGRDSGNDLVINDPSVSRQHAKVIRGKGGFYVEDQNSFNGVTIGSRIYRGQRTMLKDGTIMHFGDVPVIFEQPRTDEIGGRTMVKGGGVLRGSKEAAAPTATEPLSAVPRQRGGWALKQLPTEGRTERTWVLRNTRSGKYLQLDEKDAFIWRQLDGENTIRDILFLFAEKYDELALPRIEQALWAFASIDLVRGLYGQHPPTRPPLIQRIGAWLLRTLLRAEVSFKGLDGWMGGWYRSFGWLFFTRAGVTTLWVLILGGLFGLWQSSHDHKLFDLRGAGPGGATVIGVGYILALALHESAHALAVKSYGRKVTRGGFLLMMGMPFAFVDTSDMWFGTRWSRLVVTLSGPLATAGMAGSLALYAAYGHSAAWTAVCYQLAIGLYLNTLYNLNPLLPLDGYQALADALRMPKLREEATAYFTKGIWQDLKSGRRPGWRQIGLALYGLVALACLIGFATIGLMAWRSRLGGYVQDKVPDWVQTLVIAGGIALVFFPIWYMIWRKVSRVVSRVRARRDGSVEFAS